MICWVTSMVYKYQIEAELKALKEVDIDKYKEFIYKQTIDQHRIIWFPKTKMYFCTHCQKWHVINHNKVSFKKGDFITCGNCLKRSEVININNNIAPREMYFTLLEKNNRNELIIRVFYYSKTYNKEYGDFNEAFLEVCRMNYDCKVIMKAHSYTVMGTYGGIYHGLTHDEFKKDKAGFYKSYAYNLVLNKNVKSLIKDTEYKYSVLDMAVKQGYDILDYLYCYSVLPKIEILMKMGCYELVNSFIRRYRNRYGNGILGDLHLYDIDKKCMNLIRKYNLNYDELVMHLETKIDDYELLKKAVHIKYKPNGINKFIEKDINYLADKKYSSVDYYDYIKWCEKLGMNINDKSVRYPDNPKKAHDEAFKQYEILKDELYDKQIQEYSKELEVFCYENKELLIRPAHSHKELIIESKLLNHCVRSYAENVAKHKTSIFFIRTKEELDNPYITLELQGNKVIQCRAKDNQRPNNQVIDFVNDWCRRNTLTSCFN